MKKIFILLLGLLAINSTPSCISARHEKAQELFRTLAKGALITSLVNSAARACLTEPKAANLLSLWLGGLVTAELYENNTMPSWTTLLVPSFIFSHPDGLQMNHLFSNSLLCLLCFKIL